MSARRRRHLLARASLALPLAGGARAQTEAVPPAAGPPAPLSSLSNGARDATGAGFAFVELAGPPREVWVGERASVVLRIGFEPRFLAEALVPLFSRPLELPVEVAAPSLARPDGAVVLARSLPGDGARVRAVLDGEVVELARAEDRVELGRTWTVHELAVALRPTREGTLALGAPRLSFAYASRFDEDVVRGRVAAERELAFVEGAPLALRVLAPPAEGRPPSFAGAVGRFEVEAHAAPLELGVGESVALTLSIAGDGDLAAFEPPRLEDAQRFDLRGTLDRVVDGRREIVYDLAPRDADVRELPAVELAHFDPTPPAGYRVAATRPIAIVVRPAAYSPAARGASDERTDGGDVIASGPHVGTYALASLAVVAGLVALARARKKRRA